MHVAIDGSPLVEHPSSPAALHRIEWLISLQSAGAQVTLLHPRGALPSLPENIETVAIHNSSGTWGRIGFEQRALPRAAGELDADLLLVGKDRAPLVSPCPIVVVSSFGRGSRRSGLPDSLASAAGRAGSRGASTALYPSDLGPQSGATGYAPFVAPGVWNEPIEQQEPYVLCHGFDRNDIALILSAWTWVDGSLGDTNPLTFVGADSAEVAQIGSMAADLDVAASVRTQPDVSFNDLPSLYQGAAAYLGTKFSADGQALRWALVAGTPVVGIKTSEFESVLGGAAYLVPPGDSRTLGAACLTVLIQERVSEPLREKGRQRAEAFAEARNASELVDLLREHRKRE